MKKLNKNYVVAQRPISGLCLLIFDVFLYLTHTQARARAHTHTRYDSSERVISSSHRHNTQQLKLMNIHSVSRFGTSDPSNQAVADPRLRPDGHRSRRINNTRYRFWVTFWYLVVSEGSCLIQAVLIEWRPFGAETRNLFLREYCYAANIIIFDRNHINYWVKRQNLYH
jgi:hypothetical protein